MYISYYKNNNMHVHPECCMPICSDADIVACVCDAISDLYAIDGPECWGNDYAVYIIAAYVNGSCRDYVITPDDIENLRNGHRVILSPDGLHSMFELPGYYNSQDCEIDGIFGCMFSLEEYPNDDIKATIENCGCKWFITSPQYAPEIKHAALFVPYGIGFEWPRYSY